MINARKYKETILSMSAPFGVDKNNTPFNCLGRSCDQCSFDGSLGCYGDRLNWLLKDEDADEDLIRIILTRDYPITKKELEYLKKCPNDSIIYRAYGNDKIYVQSPSGRLYSPDKDLKFYYIKTQNEPIKVKELIAIGKYCISDCPETNFERYRDEILEVLGGQDVIGMSSGKLASCNEIRCDDCKFFGKRDGCAEGLIKWGLEEAE